MHFRKPARQFPSHGEFSHGIRPESKVSAKRISSSSLLLAAAMLGHPLFAADSELTNFKSGISLHFGDSAGTATDKGVAYAEEYFYFDKVIDDHKVVYIKGDRSTAIPGSPWLEPLETKDCRRLSQTSSPATIAVFLIRLATNGTR